MPAPNFGMAVLGFAILAFFGWWFWIICAIVARRARYVGWAFWWAALMWWFALLIVPHDEPPQVVFTGLALWAGLLLIWPIRELYKRAYLHE